MTDSSKLRGRIAEKGYTLSNFAADIEMSRPSLRRKLNDVSEFRVSEIVKICSALDIPASEVAAYFFNA